MIDDEQAQLPSWIWKPVLLRALIAAGYGILTIFWQEPGPVTMAVTGGLYLVGTGAAVYWLQAGFAIERDRAGRLHFGTSTRLLLATALLLAATGAVLLFQTPAGSAIAAAVGLIAAGVLELYLGLRYRSIALSRDWVITGVVNIGAGMILAALPALTSVQPHAVMGVLGGSAIIVAVVLILAALSLRHDASVRSAPPKAVN